MAKERPILFSAPMAQALLDGRKTQTRRVVKLPERVAHLVCGFTDYTQGYGYWEMEGRALELGPIKCPYGVPGDRLTVKEPWVTDAEFNHIPPSKLPQRARIHYLADGEAPDCAGRYRHARFLPKRLRRITLEVTRVRVERLQNITWDDARAEGLSKITKDGNLYKYGIPDRDGLPGGCDIGWEWREFESDPINAYRKLWESINGAGSWNLNPWVWVIDFKRISPAHLEGVEER